MRTTMSEEAEHYESTARSLVMKYATEHTPPDRIESAVKLVVYRMTTGETSETELEKSITLRLNAPELPDPRHTTQSHVEPQVCACGAPMHEGSVWIKPVPGPPEPEDLDDLIERGEV